MAAREESPRAGVQARRGPADDHSIVVAITGRVDRAGIPNLCESVRALLEDGDAGNIVCDVSGIVDADAATVDALARLELTVRRLGHRVRFCRASPEFENLVELMGLQEVLRATES